ncbi:MAG: alginate lyase family protein [Magnetococcales bacterium]|nr:alginate lyase family protein [Magnetococcales bacterium]
MVVGRLWRLGWVVIILVVALASPGVGESAPKSHGVGIWIQPERLAALGTSGPAWENLRRAARKPVPPPNLSDQEDPANVIVLAKALVGVRLGDASLQREVVEACLAAMGTEKGGRTLALGRELAAYVIAADLVGLPEADEKRFRAWLKEVVREDLEGMTLISTHEKRPNNWGTHAGASRLAVARYLGDDAEVKRIATIFRGWLGERSAHSGFKFGELDWQADREHPVGINPRGAKREGHDLDGVMPEEQRRSGPFHWPPPKENYVWEGLQGAVAQAVMLDEAGFKEVWQWGDQGLRRAFRWLHEVNRYPAEKDDTWQPHVINYYYRTDFPAPVPTKAGKNVGWTDWTHAR